MHLVDRKPWTTRALRTGGLAAVLGALGLWTTLDGRLDLLLAPIPQFTMLGSGVLLGLLGVALAIIAVMRREGVLLAFLGALLSVAALLPLVAFWIIGLAAISLM